MARFNLKLTRSRKKPTPDQSRGPDFKARLTQLRTLLRRRWQLTVVLGVVLAGSLYWLGLRPANSELTRWRSESQVAERRAESLRAEYKSLQSAEGAAAASARFERALELDALLPTDITPLDMLTAISNIATTAGLELGASTPADRPGVGAAEGLSYHSISIVVEGEFTRIVEFLEGLTSSQPMATVHSAKFTYTPANLEAGIAPLTRFEGEVRFWTSSIEKLGDIKADLDAKRIEDQGGKVPTTTLAPRPTIAATPETTIPAVSPDSGSASTLPVSPDSGSTSTLPSSSTPAPSTTLAPTSTQAPTNTTAPSRGEVVSGDFCSPEGATGTVAGVPYVCSKTSKSGAPFIDGKAHWRPA